MFQETANQILPKNLDINPRSAKVGSDSLAFVFRNGKKKMIWNLKSSLPLYMKINSQLKWKLVVEELSDKSIAADPNEIFVLNSKK